MLILVLDHRSHETSFHQEGLFSSFSSSRPAMYSTNVPVLATFMSTGHKLESSVWKDAPERMSPGDWPVGKSVEHFLLSD